MTTHRWGEAHRPTFETRASFDYPFDDLLLAPEPVMRGQRGDCCVAPAAFRVVLPVTARRHRPAELLLCAHHLRASTGALRRANAAIFDVTDHLVGDRVN